RNEPVDAGTRPGMTVGSKGEEGVNAPSKEPSRLQPHLRASRGDVREPRGRSVEAREDPHNAAEGQGSAADRRAANHAGEARRAARAAAGDRQVAGSG